MYCPRVCLQLKRTRSDVSNYIISIIFNSHKNVRIYNSYIDLNAFWIVLSRDRNSLQENV